MWVPGLNLEQQAWWQALFPTEPSAAYMEDCCGTGKACLAGLFLVSSLPSPSPPLLSSGSPPWVVSFCSNLHCCHSPSILSLKGIAQSQITNHWLYHRGVFGKKKPRPASASRGLWTNEGCHLPLQILFYWNTATHISLCAVSGYDGLQQAVWPTESIRPFIGRVH